MEIMKKGDMNEEELEKYIENNFKIISPGEIVDGKIVKIVENNVLVDIGAKAEGILPIDEFSNRDEIKEGNIIKVLIESEENREGIPVISKKKADFQLAWDTVKEKMETGEPLKATVKKTVKGGLLVDVCGLEAFLPGSQIDIQPVTEPEKYLKKEIEVQIIKANWDKRNIIVSRRMLLEERLKKRRQEVMESLKEGDIVEGKVKNIVNFGAFIDIQGVDALLHINDISWKKIYSPKEVLKLGDTIKVKVLTLDKNTERITVGLKQVQEYPWEDIETRYPIGSRVKGKVTGFTDQGAFVELEKGVEGMIHVNEMSWTKTITHPKEILKEGEVVETIVLSVDREEKKISLGLKQTTPDPWAIVDKKYTVNQKVKGTVTALKKFGAFVELEDGIEGLIKTQNLSWSKRIKHPKEILRKGQKIGAIILAIDKANRKLSLSLKHTREDPFYEWSREHKVGDLVQAKVIDMPSSGVVVSFTDELEGFVPIRELKEKKIKNVKDHYHFGQSLNLVVKKIDTKERRIILSERDYFEPKKEKEEEELRTFPEKFTVRDHLLLKKKKK